MLDKTIPAEANQALAHPVVLDDGPSQLPPGRIHYPDRVAVRGQAERHVEFLARRIERGSVRDRHVVCQTVGPRRPRRARTAALVAWQRGPKDSVVGVTSAGSAASNAYLPYLCTIL